jgi:uncharacterized protein YegL
MTIYNQEVVAIIDRSGSMRGKEEDTIGGINATIETLKNEKEENTNINVSIKLFDHEEYLLIRSLKLEEVRPIEMRQYVPRGQTALLDAMGNSISYFIEKKLMNSNAYDSCLIYIVTDGFENSSKTYNHEKIKKLIHKAEETYNIKVIYLAANQDAILEASKYGIDASQAMNYSETSQNVENAYRSAASVTKRFRSSGNASFTQTERQNSQLQAQDTEYNPSLPVIVRQIGI